MSAPWLLGYHTAGVSHSYAVTAAGELFTWSNGGSGKLGHGNLDDQVVPKRVEALPDACVVAVSASHTVAGPAIAVTRDGSVFGWGLAELLGVPGTATAVLHRDARTGFEERHIVSPFRFPHLSSARSGSGTLSERQHGPEMRVGDDSAS